MNDQTRRNLTWDALRREKLAATTAAVLLTNHHRQGDIPRFWSMLNDADPMVREGAVQSLVEVGGRDCIARISRMVEDVSPAVRVAVCKALGLLRAHSSKEALYDCLEDRDWKVQCAAAWALSVMGDQVGADVVYELLQQKGEQQYYALRTLNEITGQRFTVNSEGVKSARRWYKMRKRLFSS
jgi:HEAT repeat protein